MLTVFNVGQGDALLIQPCWGCKFDETIEGPLLIDTGPQKAKIALRIQSPDLSVLLTHSHEDHIGGLSALMKKKNIINLFIPYYLPEVTTIFRYVQKHCSLRIGQPNWSKLVSLHPALVSEGDELCPEHITVLNPPQNPYGYFTGYAETEGRGIEHALNVLNNYGMALPTQEILSYETPIHGETRNGLDTKYREHARTFVHQFFITLSQRVANAPHDSLNYGVDTHLELAANQASIVFEYRHPNHGKWLFTGDADETVFERLILSGKDISAKFLKVPHHGSRENLSRSTLRAIRPDVAIVSHGNRRFGRSKDAHPHHEVIEMLDRQMVRSYYTNSVIKKGVTIKPMTTGPNENGLINFV